MNVHLDSATLNLYLDDALENHARASADAHLAQCGVCRVELASLQHVADVFATWRNEPIPRDVSAPVMVRVRTRPVPQPYARWGVAALGAQVGLIVVLVAWALPFLLRIVTGVNMPPLSWPAWNWNVPMPVLPDMTLILPALSLWMWGALLAGAAVLWLVGNRLLWRSLSQNREVVQ